MADNRVEFRYTAEDVASAQRLRFFRSKQLKLLLGLWIVSTLFLLLAVQFFPPSPVLNRPLVVAIGLGYVAVIGLMVFVTPYLSYTFSRFWRLPLQLQFNEKTLRMSVVKGKSKGLQLAWKDIQRVQENQRVIILHYGEGKQFIILPKSAFASGQEGAPASGDSAPSVVERRFRDILRRRGPQPEGTAPAAPEKPRARASHKPERAESAASVHPESDADPDDFDDAPAGDAQELEDESTGKDRSS